MLVYWSLAVEQSMRSWVRLPGSEVLSIYDGYQLLSGNLESKFMPG